MYYILTENDYDEMQPNFDTFDIVNMNDSVKKIFLFLTSIYRYIFFQYLMEMLDLKKYDSLISTSNLSFLPVSKENMDVYQLIDSNDLSYFYLRNNIHIINLTNEERNNFFELIKKNNCKYNDEMKSFVASTYKKVIGENVKNNDNPSINYGPISQSFMVPNNSLVIGFRYNEFDLNGKDEYDWDKNHELQLEYIEKVSRDIQNVAKEKLKLNCVVLHYNEFSVIKKNNKY